MKALSATYRIRLVDEEIEQSIYRRGEFPIYCSWHQRFFPGITFFPRRNRISIMISKSKDGELVARIAQMIGWHPVRGSSTRGGRKALREIKDITKEQYSIGHIVDGPMGPFGVVKPGLLSIAQFSGMPILPTIASGERKWVFKSWDRFMVPKPLSRVIIRFGKETYIPENINEDAFEEARQQIERQLYDLYEDTDKLWSNPDSR